MKTIKEIYDMKTIKEIEMELAKYVGGKFSSRELNIATYFYKLGLIDGLKNKKE